MSKPIGSWLPDPFFDSYKEEELTSIDILNTAADSRESSITITIDRNFLRKIVKSHITVIHTLQSKNAN